MFQNKHNKKVTKEKKKMEIYSITKFKKKKIMPFII